MNIGKADRYITIKKATSDKQSGEAIDTYAAIGSAWAKRVFNPGTEQIQADQKVGIQNCSYEMRVIEGIEQYMVVFDHIDNTLWDIVSVEPIGRNDFIRLECYKRDNQNL